MDTQEAPVEKKNRLNTCKIGQKLGFFHYFDTFLVKNVKKREKMKNVRFERAHSPPHSEAWGTQKNAFWRPGRRWGPPVEGPGATYCAP